MYNLPHPHPRPPFLKTVLLSLQLTPNIWSNNTYSRPKNAQTPKYQHKRKQQEIGHGSLNPNSVKGDGEEVVEEDEGVADYAC
jgi:hypothetical protein